MEMAQAFDEAVRLAQCAADERSGLLALVACLEPQGKVLSELRKMDISRDVGSVRTQLRAVMKAEPPPSTLNAIYFGLFDTSDDEGEDAIGYYVAGAAAFDPEVGDSLCSPAWFPEERFLKSAALATLKKAEMLAQDRGLAELGTLLAYAGQVGVAMLVSRFASEGLFPGLRRVVGFDSGDFAEIDT